LKPIYATTNAPFLQRSFSETLPMISTSTTAEMGLPTVSMPSRRRPDLHETCQMLLRRLGWPSPNGQHPLRTLGFTSCYSGEGVSTIAAHVAFSAALSGPQRVALVDLNFNHPTVHQTLEVDQSPGVSEVLSGELSLADAVQFTSLTQFVALPVGETSALAGRLNPAALAELVDDLRASFDLVLFDLPSCDMASATLGMAGLLDGLCLVVEAERVRTEVALRTKELLARSGANLVGAVMNKQPRHVPNWLYRTL
jgi:Mrp family chromosome partitioning ATPase